MSDPPPLAELCDVRKRYPAQAEHAWVLDGVNLSVARGESLAVVGPSGCGKSTLLNLLGLLDEPSAGQVRMDGQDTATMDEPARAQRRARRIGFVFQQHHLLPACTVLENVLVPTLPAGTRHGAVDRATRLLDKVGLADLAGRFPAELSVGQAQRVAVARALINEPDLLLADEPTGSLDEAAAADVLSLLSGLQEQGGLALVVVTHDLQTASTAGRMLQLTHGRLLPAEPA